MALDRDAERVAWVDLAKGMCIILVVMMHATLSTGVAMKGEGFMHAVVAFARPFRMPDFFLLSGLFLARVIDRDWRRYADTRVVHFAYFYVLWLLIHSILKAGEVSGGTTLGLLRHLATSLAEPYSSLWFIHMLAVFSVVTKLLRRLPASALLALAAALEILPIQAGSHLINEFCGRWIYFLIGYRFAPQIFAFAAGAAARPVPALLGLGAWVLLNGVFAFTPHAGGGKLADLPVLSFALGLAGSGAVIAVAALLARATAEIRSGAARAAIGALRLCGARSIAIYLCFFLPMAATRLTIVETGAIGDVGLASLVVTAAAVIVPLLLDRVVRGTPFAFLFTRPAWAHLPPARGSGGRPAAVSALHPAE
ncbi:MAG TPA: acyltransferase family protein [Beijerinckiaceae bacterium]|jgi:uncharacterized membrane protein YcfT